MFIVYYFSKKLNKYVTSNGESISMTKLMPRGMYLTSPFNATHDGLKEYHAKLKTDQREISGMLPDDVDLPYIKFQSHRVAKLLCLNKLLPKKYQRKKGEGFLDICPRVKKEEGIWLNGCYNAGLTYAEKGTYKNVSAYDYNSYYSRILGGRKGGFKIPMCEPRFEIIKELPRKIPYGVYRAKITYDGPDDIQKVFAFSSNNFYTHIDLKNAHGLSLKRFPSLKIELIDDDTPNAMIYDDLIMAKDIFGHWFETLSEIKEKTKGNHLIKQMMNIWGFICEKSVVVKKIPWSEIQTWSHEKSLQYDMYPLDGMMGDDPIFTCIYLGNPFRTSMGRIKPFLQATARDRIAQMVRKSSIYDNIIRIYYDGLISKKPIEVYEKGVGHSMKYDKYHGHDITIRSKIDIEIHK